MKYIASTHDDFIEFILSKYKPGIKVSVWTAACSRNENEIAIYVQLLYNTINANERLFGFSIRDSICQATGRNLYEEVKGVAQKIENRKKRILTSEQRCILLR